MSAPAAIVIVGAGRHGLEIEAYLAAMGILVAGFIDDHKPRGSAWGSSTVLGGMQELGTHPYITATGSNEARRAMVERIASSVAFTLIHPYSSVGTKVEIGAGSCLAPGAIVTTNVKIGRHVILNVKASVSHDCVVGDYVNLNPGVTVCGNVNIGEGAYIGAGATVINGITIGEWAVIGAGAAVVRDVPPRVTVVGVPARVIKRHE